MKVVRSHDYQSGGLVTRNPPPKWPYFRMSCVFLEKRTPESENKIALLLMVQKS